MTQGAFPPPPPPPRRRGRGRLVGFLLVGANLVAALLLLVGIGLVVGDAPGVSDGSVVVIPGGRDYPETLPYAPFLFMDAGLDFHRLIAGIRRAAEDPRIPGIHLLSLILL